ncbi:hypothetical protein O6011_09930 [Sphingomonas aurantiaca]
MDDFVKTHQGDFTSYLWNQLSTLLGGSKQPSIFGFTGCRSKQSLLHAVVQKPKLAKPVTITV